MTPTETSELQLGCEGVIRSSECYAPSDSELAASGRPYLCPMTLRKANDFVAAHHRHNGRTARNGGKWSCGLAVAGKLVGVAIVGNPLSATLMDGWTAEVLRVCTIEAAPKGACSMLYQACWRAWRAMGGQRLITYTLQTESGASLRGAGWRVVGQTKPVKDGWRKNDHLNGTRTHSPVMLEVKNRWQMDSMRRLATSIAKARRASANATGTPSARSIAIVAYPSGIGVPTANSGNSVVHVSSSDVAVNFANQFTL